MAVDLFAIFKEFCSFEMLSFVLIRITLSIENSVQIRQVPRDGSNQLDYVFLLLFKSVGDRLSDWLF